MCRPRTLAAWSSAWGSTKPIRCSSAACGQRGRLRPARSLNCEFRYRFATTGRPDSRLWLLGLLVPYHLLSDFSHWRHRAAEFRALAATVEGDEAKEALLRTAHHYDKLAKSAEERPEPPRTTAASKPSVPPPPTTIRPQIV